MTVAARRQRVSPSGRFIIDEAGGSGPLEVGPGTQGLVLRRSGIDSGAPIAMTGAAVVVNQWRSPTDSAVAITTQDFVMVEHAVYDVMVHMPLQLPAAPAGNMIIALTARNLSTLVRSTILTATIPLPDACFHFPAQLRDAYFKPSFSFDQFQVEVTAPATCVLLVDLMGLVITQYQGS